MDTDSLIQLIFIIILIALSAFFSSAETALTMVNSIRLRNLSDEGDKRADIVLKIIEDSPKMLSAILIGNNIVNLSASALTTTFALRLWQDWGVSIATGVLTLVVLIFGEITPKTMATIKAERLSLRYSYVIYGIMRILAPVIFVVNKLSIGLLALFGVDRNQASKAMTESELRTIMEVVKDDGVIEDTEYEMIDNVFDFGDAKAKDVMVPRIDVSFINVDASFDEVLSIYARDRYTRYPVYQESAEKVIGFINVKDLLLCNNKESFDVREYIRKVHFTYESKNTAELLIEMQKDNSSYAIVLDEYGATAGLVSLEDLLEEIVGEIRDEYDYDESDQIKKVSDEEFVVDGITRLDDVNEELGLDLSSEDYESLAGYILQHVDLIPKAGDIIMDSHGNRFSIISMDKNRIDKISIKPAIKNSLEG